MPHETLPSRTLARNRQLLRTQTPELLRQMTTIAQIESTESSTRLEGAIAPLRGRGRGARYERVVRSDAR